MSDSQPPDPAPSVNNSDKEQNPISEDETGQAGDTETTEEQSQSPLEEQPKGDETTGEELGDQQQEATEPQATVNEDETRTALDDWVDKVASTLSSAGQRIQDGFKELIERTKPQDKVTDGTQESGDSPQGTRDDLLDSLRDGLIQLAAQIRSGAKKAWTSVSEWLKEQGIPEKLSALLKPKPLPPNSIDVKKLGYYLDGWAELIEGMGSKSHRVREDVLAQLEEREMPDIKSGGRVAFTNLVSSDRRDYVVSSTHPGATTTIYIAKHGKDLYASWRTFIKPILNWNTIISILILALLAGAAAGIREQQSAWYGSSQLVFMDMLGIGGAIGALILEVAVVALAGRVFKGDPLAYFIVEPNLFDAEDITGMSLSVHKSILRALDTSGIDVTKLRLKQTFKGGRRGEEI